MYLGPPAGIGLHLPIRAVVVDEHGRPRNDCGFARRVRADRDPVRTVARVVLVAVDGSGELPLCGRPTAWKLVGRGTNVDDGRDSGRDVSLVKTPETISKLRAGGPPPGRLPGEGRLLRGRTRGDLLRKRGHVQLLRAISSASGLLLARETGSPMLFHSDQAGPVERLPAQAAPRRPAEGPPLTRARDCASMRISPSRGSRTRPGLARRACTGSGSWRRARTSPSSASSRGCKRGS